MLTMTGVPPRRLSDPVRGGVALAHVAEVAGGVLHGDGELRVTGVQQDSRRVAPGDLFVALAGGQVDGARFAPMAIEAGAVAVLVEGEPLELDVPQIVVSQTRQALAKAAAEVYARPTETLPVVGITGTNGKTTTSHLLEHLIAGAGGTPGIVGTLGYRCGGLSGPLIHTSPEADELQRVARAIVDEGASHLVMEVSSIALAADRVAEVEVDVAAFTNLTQDHLDWHGSMEAYAAAKERLFFEWAPRVAVVVVDEPYGAALADRISEAGKSRVLRVAAAGGEGDVRVVERRLGLGGVELTLSVGGRELAAQAPLPGEHNVQNIAVAAGVVAALELDLDAALASLPTIAPVPGRLELVSTPADDLAGLVDYAHTPDALERVLATLRAHVAGRLWCLFGCGGDRDRTKRGPMGAAVARAADVAIVTNDNPRSEDPQSIADAVVEGIVAAGGDLAWRVELDREAAIDAAVAEAAPGDVILVAGKGHEPYQIIGDRRMSFDDRVVLRRALARRRAPEEGSP